MGTLVRDLWFAFAALVTAHKTATGLLCVLLALGFLPLCGGPTYECALITGLLVPLPTALVAARRVLRLPERSLRLALGAGAKTGALFATAAALSTTLHAARVGLCDPWGQALFFCLGPVAGVVLGGLYGGMAGWLSARLVKTRGLAVALTAAAAGPLGGILVSLARYYTSPIIFAFDPFVGFFSGTLYDTIMAGTERLFTYRLGHGLLVLGLWLAAQSREGRVATPSRLGAGAAFLGYGLTLWFGSELGHFQTASSLRRTLGHEVSSSRCSVVYAGGIAHSDAQRLLSECNSHIEEQEAYFEVHLHKPLTVYAFSGGAQKARLMGARNVYIAKPWRREVYIQAQGFPHPVLGHEIAHVLAGEFGQGPFLIAGPLGGLIPDPGRIEGFAVAASPRWDEDFSAETWAAALLALQRLPPIEQLFRLGFLGQNSSAAYTVSGAFIEFVRQRVGMAPLKAWYGGTAVKEAFGESLATLDGAFRAHLATVNVSAEVLAVARARFERPALFGRRCPHQVDALLAAGGRALTRLEPAAAATFYHQALALAPNEYAARRGLMSCRMRASDLPGAEAELNELLSEPWLSTSERLDAEEALGDVLLALGRAGAAADAYASALRRAVSEDLRRTLQLKGLGAQRAGAARKAIVDLLIGAPELGTDPLLAGTSLADWARGPHEVGPDADAWIGAYLVGKNLSGRGRHRDALSWLDQALEHSATAPNAVFERALLRARVVAGCALGEMEGASDSAAELYLARPDVTRARRAGFQRFVQRCRGTKRR